MDKIKYKTVLMPIKVPDCEYCWEPTPPYRICPHFDNEGGHPLCKLNCGKLKYGNGNGVMKPQTCAILADSKV